MRWLSGAAAEALANWYSKADWGNVLVLQNGPGVAVLHDWQPRYGTVELSTYTQRPGWLTRGVIRELGRHVFGAMECQACLMNTGNGLAVKTAQRLGCEIARIPRGYGRNHDKFVCVLTQEVWAERWANENTGTSRAA